MAYESYYWSRETARDRKETFWSNGELQLRFYGPIEKVDASMKLILAVFPGPRRASGPPPPKAKLPPIHPGQTDLISALEGGDEGD